MWRRLMVVFVACVTGVVAADGSDATYDAAGAVWPRPKFISHEYGEWFWRLHPQSLMVAFEKQGSQWDAVHEILSQAEQRYADLIPVAATAKQEREGVPGRVIGVAYRIHVNIMDPTTTLNLDTREDYVLYVNSQGLRIDAHTVFGVLRGLETVAQLVEPRAGIRMSETVETMAGDFIVQDPSTRYYIECVKIDDAPAFKYRGLMIDTSRHYLPVPTIERMLDAMEANKLNVLHWHVSDEQSFPFQSQTYPKLSKAAWLPARVYTHFDVRHIVQQALFRGIQVVPEFDTPGHTASFGVGYPDVMAQCPSVYGPENYMLNPIKESARTMVMDLLKEILGVFGVSDLIHLGGDEVDTTCLEHCKEVQDYMMEHNITDEADLIADYQTFLQKFVSNILYRTSIVWEEVFDNDLPMMPNTIVDVWKTRDDVGRVVKANRRALLSSCWYLDHLGDDWRTMYACDPLDFYGTAEEKARVLGGHASMWGEKVDENNVISRTWPRASAVAERLWSAPSYTNNETVHNDLEDRLDLQRCRMVARGIGASPVRPGTCAFE